MVVPFGQGLMTLQGDGTGRLVEDLGPLGELPVIRAGTIGGPSQPSTLLIRFRLEVTSELTLITDRTQPRSKRFVDLQIQDAANLLLPLEGDTPLRVSAGSYDIVITTLDWRTSPWAFELRASRRDSLRGRCQAAPGMRFSWGIKRLAARSSAMPGLGGILKRTVRLQARAGLEPGLRSGLAAIPNYEPPSTDLLSHAWVVQTPSVFKVGSADGLSWLEAAGLVSEPVDYPPTPLLLTDYTANTPTRLVFSLEAPSVYAANPGIGPVPADVTAPTSPDYPALSFLSLTSGAYRRDVVFSLPAGNDRQVLVQLRETLRWGNDIIRDLPVVGGPYTVVNRSARFASDRRLFSWLVTRTSVRALGTVPTVLATRISSLLPPLASSMITRALVVPGATASRVPVSCVIPSFIAAGTLPGEGDAVFLSPPEAPFSGLPISYGLTRLLRADRDFFSAAIYDTLAAGGTLFQVPGYDPQSYAFVASQLPSLPSGLAQISPSFQGGAWAESGTSDEIYASNAGAPLLYNRWDGTLPASAATAVSPVSPSWTFVSSGLTLEGARLNRSDAPRALVASDWGLPIPARIRLLELGFSSGDLEAASDGDPRFLALSVRTKATSGLRGAVLRYPALSVRTKATPGLRGAIVVVRR
jgi:hypothetical protein